MAAPASTSEPPGAESVRVYVLHDSRWEFIADLGLSDGSHHAAEEAPEQATAQAEGEAEVLLVFCNKGSISGVAYLLPDAPRQSREDDEEEDEDEDDDGEVDEVDGEVGEDDDDVEDEHQHASTRTATDESSSNGSSANKENKHGTKVDADWGYWEDNTVDKTRFYGLVVEDDDGEEDASTDTVTSESSNNRSSNDKENETETEGDGYDYWNNWDEDDTEKQETKSESAYSLKLKIWPSYAYSDIVLFGGLAWNSTSSYSFRWLPILEAHLIVEKLADLSQLSMKLADSTLVSNAIVLRSEYEGEMVNSWAIQMFVKHKLSPSLYDFNDQELLLGKGAFSNVRLCTSRLDKKDYAIKIIKIKEYDPKEPREVSIFSSLRSPYVVKFLQAWTETHLFVDYEECSSEDDTRKEGPIDRQRPKYVVIQMELCPMSLEKYISTNSRKIDDETSHIFKEIVQGLKYIHGENVIHRDIKPANIFMGKDGIVKLGDFGQSRVHPRHAGPFKGTPYVGTVYYEAPELRKAENISEKVDIHSAGAIYLELYHKFETVVEKTTKYQQYKMEDISSINWEGNALLFKKMVASDPLERPSADEIFWSISQNCDALCTEEK